jgi:hypothetical protein
MHRLRPTLTLLSTFSALVLLLCWLVHHHWDTSSHLCVGRGYQTVDLDAEPHTLTIVVNRLNTPLTRYFPEAPFLRTERYDIWVARIAQRRIELGDFKSVSDQGIYPDGSMFMTTRSLTIPYWFALLTTAILPALWLKRRLTPNRPGFALDQAVRSKPLQSPPGL